MYFGLCRILISIINGNVNKGTEFFPTPAMNDQVWDAVAESGYFRIEGTGDPNGSVDTP
jgi:hypothetical protein